MAGRDDRHPRDPFAEMDRFVQSIFGGSSSSSFFSTPSLFHTPNPRNPSPTAKTIPIGGPGRDAHPSESEARQALPPTITELPDKPVSPTDPESQEEAEEEPHWMFPTSQPDTVEEPESDVIDLVESSSYEEEDEEGEGEESSERQQGVATASAAKVKMPGKSGK